MDVKRIGEAAGAVWNKLRSSTKPLALIELKKVPGFTADELLAGLGWLAREGKLTLAAEGRKVVVSLVEQELFA